MRLSDYLGLSRVVAYSPDVARALGSVTAALLLAQLWHWSRRAPGEWIAKSREDIEAATALSRREQESARKVLCTRGLLQSRRAGMPQRLEFRLVVEAVTAVDIEPARRAETAHQDGRKPPTMLVQNRPSKGIRDKQEEEQENNTSRADARDALTDRFEDEFWRWYPKERRHAKAQCLALYRKLSEADHAACAAGLQRWIDSQQWADPSLIVWPERFLKRRDWDATPMPWKEPR